MRGSPFAGAPRLRILLKMSVFVRIPSILVRFSFRPVWFCTNPVCFGPFFVSPSVLVRFSFRPSKKFEERRPAPLSITTVPGRDNYFAQDENFAQIGCNNTTAKASWHPLDVMEFRLRMQREGDFCLTRMSSWFFVEVKPTSPSIKVLEDVPNILFYSWCKSNRNKSMN